MDRVSTTLGFAEPDRVPVFLLLNLHCAKELGLGLEEYFSRPEHRVEAQLRMRRRFGHDCLLSFSYSGAEYEAFGGQAIFADDGPPNAGAPVIRTRQDIFDLEVPDIRNSPGLQASLEVTRRLADAAVGEVPVIGYVIGPFSLPVMLMGFERYFDLMHDDPLGFQRLMAVTQRFCADWANAQLACGATFIGCAEPLSAVNITEGALFERAGLPVMVDTFAQIRGAVALSMASGRALGRVESYLGTGAVALHVSHEDDLVELRRQCDGRAAILGNLNGVAMASWTTAEARQQVRVTMRAAGPGGGFILADNHGEIPLQVSDDVLLATMDAACEHGRYPLGSDTDD